MARLEACPFDEGLVVIVGAGGASQDPHEVTVVAQVLQKAGHPPEESVCGGRGGFIHWLRRGVRPHFLFLSELNPVENLRSVCKLRVIM